MSNAKVELFDVALKGCEHDALNITNVTSETTVVATRCEFANSYRGAIVEGGLSGHLTSVTLSSATFNNCLFHDNSGHGLLGRHCTIHLHGEATAIHSNGEDGIWLAQSGKVIIHLPSHHNTTYNNGRRDRSTHSGSTITNVPW